jgi:membrane-associated phospholipid phosphatase
VKQVAGSMISGSAGAPGGRARRPPRRTALGLAIGAALVAGLVLLAIQVEVQGPVTALDLAIREWTWQHRVRTLARVSAATADLGAFRAPLILLGVAVRRARRIGSWTPLVDAVFVLITVSWLVIGLKAAFHRPGPELPPQELDLDAFPSGHTLFAVSCYGIAALLSSFPGGPRWRRPLAAAPAAVVAIALIYIQ